MPPREIESGEGEKKKKSLYDTRHSVFFTAVQTQVSSGMRKEAT